MNLRKRIRWFLHHLPLIVWLWLLWLVLWGSTGPVVLVGGLLVALLVVALFPLPSVLPGAVPRPLWIGLLLFHLLVDLVRSGITVAWEAVRYGRRTRAAIIEVPLRVDDDVLVTAVAEITTIAPGTVVAEIDRRRRRLYVHTLPVRDRETIARRRKETQDLDRRVARSVGHHHGPPHDAPPDDPPPHDAPPDDPPPDDRGSRR